jgi:diguanylate cyclase (GGDEF)-like protein
VLNDTHGHATGDVVLRELAALVAGKLRTEDVFAWIGGEGFIVVARGLTTENKGRASPSGPGGRRGDADPGSPA